MNDSRVGQRGTGGLEISKQVSALAGISTSDLTTTRLPSTIAHKTIKTTSGEALTHRSH